MTYVEEGRRADSGRASGAKHKDGRRLLCLSPPPTFDALSGDDPDMAFVRQRKSRKAAETGIALLATFVQCGNAQIAVRYLFCSSDVSRDYLLCVAGGMSKAARNKTAKQSGYR